MFIKHLEDSWLLPKFEGILNMLQISMKNILDGMTVAIAGYQTGQSLMEQELGLAVTELVPILEACLVCLTVRHDLFTKYSPLFDNLINEILHASNVVQYLVSMKLPSLNTCLSLLLILLSILPDQNLSDTVSSLILLSVTHSLLLKDNEESSASVERSYWQLITRSWPKEFHWTLRAEVTSSSQLATVTMEAFCIFFHRSSEILREQMITAVIASLQQCDDQLKNETEKSLVANKICQLFYRLIVSFQESGHILESQQWVGIVRDVMISALKSTCEENRLRAEDTLVRLSELGVKVEGNSYVKMSVILRKGDHRNLQTLTLDSLEEKVDLIRVCCDSESFLMEGDVSWILTTCIHCLNSLQDEGNETVVETVARMVLGLVPFAKNSPSIPIIVHFFSCLSISPAVLSVMAILAEQDPDHYLNDQTLSYFWNAINSTDSDLQQAAVLSLQLLVSSINPPSWLLFRCLQLHQRSVM